MNNKQIKLLKFLGTIAVIGGGITTTILTTSCGKTLSDIASIINVRNLGVIESNTEDVIKSKIEDLNSNASNLKWSQLQITAITSTSAYISAIENSTVYKGYAKITFTLPEKVNISSIISIIDLEEVESATEQAIQTKVVELNSEAGNLEWNQIRIVAITPTSAHIAAKTDSTLYVGYVDVIFTLPAPILTQLSSVITINLLGEIESDTEQAIQTKVVELNSEAGNLEWNQIEISEISSTSAHISAKEDSTLYAGYVDVTFTTSTVSYNAQGTNWEGYTSGTLTCILNNTDHTCIVSNGSTYAANNLVIPDAILSNGISYEVIEIDDRCFYSNTNLTGTLTLGDNLTIIGDASFYGCRNITGQLIFPNSITDIFNDAFNSCRQISGQITLPNNPNFTTINDGVFAYAVSITTVVMSNNITAIDNAAFTRCSNLTRFTCNFASAPALGEDSFFGVSNAGVISNLNGAYSSSDLCDLFKTAGLPDGWTPD